MPRFRSASCVSPSSARCSSPPRSPPATAPRSAPRRISSALRTSSPPATRRGPRSSSATSSRLNAEHAPARLAYARLLRDRGEPEAAFAQYLRLAEQAPDDVTALGELVELALALGHGADARAHVEFAYARLPADPRVRGLKATLDFAAGEHEVALAMAADTLAEDPGNVPARLVAIAGRLQAGDAAGARAEAEAGLARAPADQSLLLARLAAIEEAGDDAAVGAALADMAERLPDNPDVRRALARWYLGAGDAAAAEAELRALAAADPDDPQAALAVVRFLLETGGDAAARTELERLAATAADPAPFRRVLAGLDFAEGRTDAAIAALRALVDGAAPSDARRDTEVALAGMLDATGDAAGRDALVAAVLAADPTHVAALKLRARAAIAADRPEQAVEDMRTALAQAPDDPEIMTIQALAHAREGSRDARRRAVRTGGRGLGAGPGRVAALRRLPDAGRPRRTGRGGGRRRPARGAAGPRPARHARRASMSSAATGPASGRRPPGCARRATRRATRPRRAPRPGSRWRRCAARAGPTRRWRCSRRWPRTATPTPWPRRCAAISRSATPRRRRPSSPGCSPATQRVPTARLLQAELSALAGDTAAAEAALPGAGGRGSRPAGGAPRARRAARRARPPRRGPRRDRGGARRHRRRRRDCCSPRRACSRPRATSRRAIAAYETLYARDGDAPVVVNNLASLLTGRGSTPSDLERAFAIARRLRESRVPHFRDT